MKLEAIPFIVVAFVLVGCAPTPPPRFARLRDLGTVGPLQPNQPLVLEVERGDTIPLRFSLDGPLFQSPKDSPPIMLEATRHFFLRIDKNGLKSSFDRNDFGGSPAAPGQFQIGFGVSPKGAEAKIAIRTPMPHGGAR